MTWSPLVQEVVEAELARTRTVLDGETETIERVRRHVGQAVIYLSNAGHEGVHIGVCHPCQAWRELDAAMSDIDNR